MIELKRVDMYHASAPSVYVLAEDIKSIGYLRGRGDLNNTTLVTMKDGTKHRVYTSQHEVNQAIMLDKTKDQQITDLQVKLAEAEKVIEILANSTSTHPSSIKYSDEFTKKRVKWAKQQAKG